HAAGYGGNEHDVGTTEDQSARRLRKVAVVANEDADPRAERCRKRGEAEVAGPEVELLVAARLRAAGAIHERDAGLPILADDRAIRPHHRRGVVEEPVVRPLEDRTDEHGGRLPRE